MQYLTWGLAAAYLINLRLATLYNLAASASALMVYSTWNQAPPWRWDVASAVAFTAPEVLLMVVTWTFCSPSSPWAGCSRPRTAMTRTPTARQPAR